MSLVGAGPGDPALLTLGAVRALGRADVVLYDALVHPSVLQHARPDAELRFVGKRGGHEGISQAELNALLLDLARSGRRVCRLKGGDPFLFGRGSEEAEVLAREGISFEVIPGVTAALGATTYAGISLTHREWSSSVAFVTSAEHAEKSQSAHDWQKLATATQTLVIYMGVRKLRGAVEKLLAHGRSAETPAAVIQAGTLPSQRVVTGTLSTIAERVEAEGLGAPALIVVGEVVRLREQLRWFDQRPLQGKRVLVTRAEAQSEGMLNSLLERGAEAVSLPAIRFREPTDRAALERALQRLEDYHLVLFTSTNTVERFFRELEKSGGDTRRLGRALVGAVGPATALALGRYGVRADATPEVHRGEALAEATLALLADRSLPPAEARVLLPRAEAGREALPEQLRAAGVRVDTVAVYATEAAPREHFAGLRGELLEGAVDALTFTSPSTVDAVLDGLGEAAPQLLAPVVLASLGPVTSERARARGLEVTVEAATTTTEALLDALEAHYRSAR